MPKDTASVILPPTPQLSNTSNTDLAARLVEVDHSKYLSQIAEGDFVKGVLHDLNIRHES